MQSSTTCRLTLEATIERSVIRGTLITSSGDRRAFHGWLELNTAIEAMLDADAGRAPNDSSTVANCEKRGLGGIT